MVNFSQKFSKVLFDMLQRIDFGNIHDSTKYREIVISTNLSKVLVYCLLPKLENHIGISSYQFG